MTPVVPPPAAGLATPPHALFVDAADSDLGWVLTKALHEDGYAVTRVGDERAALAELSLGDVQVVIVDLAEPATRVAPFCERLRAEGYAGPVLVSQGSPHELHVVDALDSGADAYLAAPHSVLELRARVRAVVRRRPTRQPGGTGLRLDPSDRSVAWDGRVAMLSRREFELFAQLHARAGSVVAESDLRARLWPGSTAESKVVGVTVGRLRAKLTGAGIDVAIVSARGRGYRLDGATNL